LDIVSIFDPQNNSSNVTVVTFTVRNGSNTNVTVVTFSDKRSKQCETDMDKTEIHFTQLCLEQCVYFSRKLKKSYPRKRCHGIGSSAGIQTQFLRNKFCTTSVINVAACNHRESTRNTGAMPKYV